MEETSTKQTWVIEYVGGSGERLRFPLANGTEEVFRGVPIIVDDYDDYRRLTSNPDKYKDVTPKTESDAVEVVELVTLTEKAESPAKAKGGKQ